MLANPFEIAARAGVRFQVIADSYWKPMFFWTLPSAEDMEASMSFDTLDEAARDAVGTLIAEGLLKP